MKRAELNAYIVEDPEICHGKPTFKNTRVMVWQILEMLKSGETTGGIRKAYPSIRKEHIQAALDYEAGLKRTLRKTPGPPHRQSQIRTTS